MIRKPKEIDREKYTEDDYDEMLDDCYGDVQITGLSYSTSYALKNLDPIAYRCGFADYQEYETVYVCPICEEEHEKVDDARWCCQDMPSCPICNAEYETEEEAEQCEKDCAEEMNEEGE